MRLFNKKIDVEEIIPLILFTVFVNNKPIYKMNCMLEDENRIMIGDIVPANPQSIFRQENRGYGSLLMEELLLYAKENNIKELYGNLATVDIDHKDRLIHYYKKFGFEVNLFKESKNGYFGRISKIESVKLFL